MSENGRPTIERLQSAERQLVLSIPTDEQFAAWIEQKRLERQERIEQLAAIREQLSQEA